MSSTYFAYKTYKLILVDELRGLIDHSIESMVSSARKACDKNEGALPEALKDLVNSIPDINQTQLDLMSGEILARSPHVKQLCEGVVVAATNMLSTVRLVDDNKFTLEIPPFSKLVHAILIAIVPTLRINVQDAYINPTPSALVMRMRYIDEAIKEGVRKVIPWQTIVKDLMGSNVPENFAKKVETSWPAEPEQSTANRDAGGGYASEAEVDEAGEAAAGEDAPASAGDASPAKPAYVSETSGASSIDEESMKDDDRTNSPLPVARSQSSNSSSSSSSSSDSSDSSSSSGSSSVSSKSSKSHHSKHSKPRFIDDM
jgi:hypothetical protein